MTAPQAIWDMIVGHHRTPMDVLQDVRETGQRLTAWIQDAVLAAYRVDSSALDWIVEEEAQDEIRRQIDETCQHMVPMVVLYRGAWDHTTQILGGLCAECAARELKELGWVVSVEDGDEEPWSSPVVGEERKRLIVGIRQASLYTGCHGHQGD